MPNYTVYRGTTLIGGTGADSADEAIAIFVGEMGCDPTDLRAVATIDMDALSDDAKVLAGCHLGLMRPGGGSVTFQTPWNRTARCAAAWDELVEKGVCTAFPLNAQGAVVYKPAVDCAPSFQWMRANVGRPELAFSVMVPDAERKERRPKGYVMPAGCQ